VTYLRGLGYLLGLEGFALLKGMREGVADRSFVEGRIAEIRQLLDEPALARAEGVEATPGGISTQDVYEEWAPSYDGPNSMIDLEEPRVRALLDTLPVGTALDAACGTGRHTAYLAGLGHHVIGVDASPGMLARARNRLPGADLREADLHAIPLDNDTVDLVVCALALAHLPDLKPVLAEFARVLRPGGHLIISDAHHLLAYVRPILARRPGTDGRPSILREYHHPLSDYLAAALPAGFQVRHCEEIDRGPGAPDRPGTEPRPTHVSWEIHNWCPKAAAYAMNVPVVVVWHFQLEVAGEATSRCFPPTR
jgi:SAM-dependent methyltransferase